MALNEIIGQILILIGIIFIAIGIYGLYKFHNFYTRVAIASLIDTAGFVLVAIGIMVYKGFSFFTFKLAIVVFLMILLNPLSSHIMVRGAHSSGYSGKEH